MTLRLTDEDQKKLDFIKDHISYSCLYSKGVRYAISFTFELMQKLVLKSKPSESRMVERLDKEYKINIEHWRYY
jgi:hypothetical protein